MTAGLRRTMVIFVLDMLCIAGSFFLALWMRFEFRLGAIPQMYLNEYLKIIGPWIVICLVVFQLFRLYNSIWSFVSIDELFRIILAYGVLLAAGLAYVLILKIDMPRSFYFAGFIMSFFKRTVTYQFGVQSTLAHHSYFLIMETVLYGSHFVGFRFIDIQRSIGERQRGTIPIYQR